MSLTVKGTVISESVNRVQGRAGESDFFGHRINILPDGEDHIMTVRHNTDDGVRVTERGQVDEWSVYINAFVINGGAGANYEIKLSKPDRGPRAN